MPEDALLDTQVHKEGPDQAQVEAVVAAALSLFTRNNKPVPFVLTLLNLGACNFTSGGSGGSAPMPAAFARFLKAKPDSQPEDAAGLQTNDPADTSKPGKSRSCHVWIDVETVVTVLRGLWLLQSCTGAL